MDGNDANWRTPSQSQFSREDLLHLLSCFEGEIEARDIVIATFKSEKAKQLLYDAKYGRLIGNDPFRALQRDSNFVNESLDESLVGQIYESQLSQLERLICVQRRCHNRSKQILAATERRHLRILRELDAEKERSAADAAQGDDLCALLEKERSRLKQQLEFTHQESNKIQAEVEKLEKRLQDEKERHKSMILFLINERKQMLLNMHVLKVQSENSQNSQTDPILSELRKEIATLHTERSQLRSALDSSRNEIFSLKEIIRNQEEDLNLMRNSLLASTRSASLNNAPNSSRYTHNVQRVSDGSVVVVNKGISASLPAKKIVTSPISDSRTTAVRSRLPSSSSFPAGDRTGNHHSRVPLPSPRSTTSPVTTMPPSPSRKRLGNQIGLRPSSLSNASRNGTDGLSTDRTRITTTSGSERVKCIGTYEMEPEIEQLGAVIDSMNTNKINKRSASLPRSNNSKKDPSPTKASALSTQKRSGLFKAFGVSSRSEKSGS